MVDLRYLGLTLIGVFLALAVGLMTGSALSSPDRRDLAYEGLRTQFEELRGDIQRVQRENDDVRRRIDARDRAARDLLPLAVRGRLPGSRVAVVICGPLDERPFWGDLERTLELAGAEIGPVARVPDPLRPLSPALRSRFAAQWSPDDLGSEPAEHEAAAWLIHGLARGDTSGALEELARETGIELRRYDGSPVRRLLLLTAPGDERRAASLAAGDLPEFRIAEAAKREGIRLVAAEPEDADPSVVDMLGREGVTTVDNIGTAYGQLSAVLALAGADGRFGSKPGASRAIPPLEAP